MVCILHIARDYPDFIDTSKTSSVRNLVNNVRSFQQYVFSLNKTSHLGKERIVKNEEAVYSIEYLSMPYGLLMHFFLVRTAKRLLKVIKQEGIKPDLIHCHKLTHEGIVGFYLSQRLGIPLVCSVRGDTDLTVMSLKPNYHLKYTRILNHAKCIFFIAPWTRDIIIRRNGPDIGIKTTLLPNITGFTFDKLLDERQVKNVFVTICHLNDYKRKNISRIICAMDQCISDGLDVSLDIIGGGPKAVTEKLYRDINKCRNSQNFRLLGHINHSVMMTYLSNYAGLILPSYPETFGMVYLEALHSGIPFIHSQNSGVDGYFPDNNVSISVNPKSVKSITAGITELYSNQVSYKDNIRHLMNSGHFEQFSTTRIVESYENTIMKAVES